MSYCNSNIMLETRPEVRDAQACSLVGGGVMPPVVRLLGNHSVRVPVGVSRR